MGLLIDGKWHDQWYNTEKTKGAFVRQASQFRQFITHDGSSGFKAEPNRYHLYLSLACPWACRALIFLYLKKLHDMISISIVHPLMREHGWEFSNDYPSCIPDTISHHQYLYQLYTQAQPNYSGRVTVPVLWDKQQNTIVNNESSEIIRMLNNEFNHLVADTRNYYPTALHTEIDTINELVYEKINNGVYRCGFATTQEAYETAFAELFAALDHLEQLLSKQRYLAGKQITEADWRLFTTLIRFDAVYHYHFKCNLRKIKDYHHLSNYLRELYQISDIKETVNMDHIKTHYYASHETINPTRIVPLGPQLDFDAPHDREQLIATPY